MVAYSPLLAAAVLIWGGSFEIDRLVHALQLDAPIKALHMGLSLYWALWACGLLAGGFVRKSAPARYFAIGLFALTLGKVFVLDMQGVEAPWRIGSFMALGLALVGGSWWYHRFFKTASDEIEKESL